jgi:hypothetical protein
MSAVQLSAVQLSAANLLAMMADSSNPLQTYCALLGCYVCTCYELQITKSPCAKSSCMSAVQLSAAILLAMMADPTNPLQTCGLLMLDKTSCAVACLLCSCLPPICWP